MKILAKVLSSIIGITFFTQVIFGAMAYWIILDDHKKSHVTNIKQMEKVIKNNFSPVKSEIESQQYIEKLQKNFTTDEAIVLLKTDNQIYTSGRSINDGKKLYQTIVNSKTNKNFLAGGTLKFNGIESHWNSTKIKDETQLFIVESCIKYKTDSNLAVRLIATSIIIMWIAIWVALILSHIISKSLTDKNNELKHQAYHDKLTNLPNRLSLIQKLDKAIENSQESGKPFTLLLMDLDNFKELNDTLGHHYGDELLQKISKKIEQSLEESSFAARLGGDEFATILHDTDLDETLLYIAKLQATMKIPHLINESWIESKASIGVAIFPFHGDNQKTLLQHADIAMYQAKKLRSGYTVYDKSFDMHSVRRLQLMNELRHAVDNQHIRVCYQPMICAKQKTVETIEALVRWYHPDLGEVSPEEFIPAAEQTGIIRRLTLFVLKTALRNCKSWRDQGYDINVAINISPRCLQDTSFYENLLAIVEDSGMSTSNIELEITETALMQDLDSANTVLEHLGDAGFKISIDDFGTGYSSLEHMKKLPIDTLKIDKSFVLDMNENKNDRAIVHSVTELGHNLNYRVIAEGVEDEITMNALIEIKVDVLQGYLISHAITRQALDKWFKETHWKVKRIKEKITT